MLHCVPFPDAGAPAMMILGGGAPASIAMPLPEDAAQEEEDPTLSDSHLLPRSVATDDDLGDTGRDAAVLAAAGFETPNQLRVPADDGALTTGLTKAESVLVRGPPSGASAAAVQQARLSVAVSATNRLRPQFRRRTFCDRMIVVRRVQPTTLAPTLQQAQNSKERYELFAMSAERDALLEVRYC